MFGKPPEEYDAFINISSNKGLVIPKAGREKTVVLLDCKSHVAQMEELLPDKSKSVKVTFNPKHQVNKEVDIVRYGVNHQIMS